MSGSAKSSRRSTRRDPVYSPNDPDRLEYFQSNAVALIRGRDAHIDALIKEIRRLGAKNRSRSLLLDAARSVIRVVREGHGDPYCVGPCKVCDALSAYDSAHRKTQ